MKLALFALCSAGLAPAAPAASTASVPGSTACAPENGIHYVCGLINVEDFLPIEGGRYLVGGSYTDHSVGFYLIDTRRKEASAVPLSVASRRDPIYADCPGAPDLAQLSTHGLDVRVQHGAITVYAINHGGRESVEVFRLSLANKTAEWIGCVVAPEGTRGNAVASLPGGSIAFTKFRDLRQPDVGTVAILAGHPTGVVYVWTPGHGTRVLPGSELAGDNGIAASRDGRTLFVNAYGSDTIWRLPLSGDGERVSAKVDFEPDNLRWAPDGTLFVTGQYLRQAKPGEPHDWAIARLDPKSMAVTLLLRGKGTTQFDDATSTVQVGDTFWVGTFHGDRVAYLPVP
jgi:hypothetical protein